MTDRQRAAYVDATEADWAQQAALLADCVVHKAGDLDGVLTPDEWHVTGWDADRLPPKTLDEAKTALAARIADPDAPDTEDVAGAYDGLGD